MLFVRSLIFTFVLLVSVVVAGTIVSLALLVLPHAIVYRMVLVWARFALWSLKIICGLGYQVEGLENIPEANSVVYIKHQSAYETIVELVVFPRQCWVLKRELMWAPFVGWALLGLKPIAINRRAGRSALQQVLDQGKNRLEEGLWVMIFPEGTRVAPGGSKRYGLSGALLARNSDRMIVPVAHNAGDFWPRRTFSKKPGTMQFCIGPPIPTANRRPDEINAQARAWIEGKMAEISNQYSATPDAPIT